MTKEKEEFTLNRIIDCLTKINFKTDKYTSSNTVKALSYLSNDKAFARIENNDHLNVIQKADLCFQLFLNTKQPYFIFKAGNLSSQYQFIAKVVDSLINNVYLDRSYIDDECGQKVVQAFFNNLVLTEQDMEVFSDDLISRERKEQFYEAKKNAANSADLAPQAPEAATGWYKDQVGITYKQATEIGQFDKKGKLYGYIAPKFDKPVWHQALEKAMASTAQGTNGVKFLNGRLLELKIKGDARLYTTVVQKNDLGDYLAIFGQEANHLEIKYLTNSKKVPVEFRHGICIDTKWHSEPTYGVGDFTGTQLELAGNLDHGTDFDCAF